MRPLHHRDPGPVGALLDSPVDVELVADGVHLHPAVLRTVFAAKPGRCILVSDAMAAAGAPDGDYTLGQMGVEVRDGIARLASEDGDGAIAGSTLTMDAGRALRRTRGALAARGRPRREHRPRARLGPRRGRRDRGRRRADLVVLDDDLEVLRVMRAGAWTAP